MLQKAVFVKIIFILSIFFIFSPPTFATSDCPDVQFIFARGSGSPLNDRDYRKFKSSIKNELKRHNSQLSYEFHELGSSSSTEIKYPATDVRPFNVALGAVFSAGKSHKYGNSVKSGVAELSSLSKSLKLRCPRTRLVLGGYSQGAQVVSQTAPKLPQSQLLFASTFGDPKLFLPEGRGLIPPACLGQKFSLYRAHVPDCRTDDGILTGSQPYVPNQYQYHFGAWCNAGDFMCGSYFDFKQDVLAAHLAYNKDSSYPQAARFIVNRLKQAFPQKFRPSISRDTVFLIDTTGSMQDLYVPFVKYAKELAEKTLQDNGRISLFQFRDFTDFGARPARPLCNFRCSLADFRKHLKNLVFSGGGDEPEAVLSSLKQTMQSLNWRKGAVKSIVLLTDSSLRAPDQDGTTLSDVIKTSLIIDPVNIYPVTTNPHDYQALAKESNGKVVNPLEDPIGELNTTLLSRPSALLDRESYEIPLEAPITFDASPSIASTAITKFEWDLDGDNVFELSSHSPILTTRFSASHPLVTGQALDKTPFSKFIQLKVTDSAGFSSTMSATVKFLPANSHPVNSPFSDFATLPLLKNLKTKSSHGRFEISFSPDPAIAQVLVIINDELLGLTDKTTFAISRPPASATLKLVPVGINGRRGQPTEIRFNSPATPSTGYRPSSATRR